MGVSAQRHAPVALYPRERTSGTHWIGVWMGLRAGLETRLEKNSFSVPEIVSDPIRSVFKYRH
jgi:hypothetical protein